MSEHAFEDRIGPKLKPIPEENDNAHLFSEIIPVPGANLVPNPAPISYSQVLEQTRDRKEFIKPSVVKRKQLIAAKFIQKVRDKHSI